jgi:hypothetical protein
VEYEGAVYHVMNRGDRRESIFGAGKAVETRAAVEGVSVEQLAGV